MKLVNLLVAGLFVSSVVGCGGGNENDSNDGVTPDADSLVRVNKAIVMAKDAVQENQFQLAHDYLLHAITIAPSNPNLFEAVLEVSSRMNDANNELAFDFADDLLIRAASMVPFQPLETIADARRGLERAWQRIEEEDDRSSENDFSMPRPIDEFQQYLDRAKDASVPSRIRLLAVERARTALEQDGLESVDWNDWNARLETLDEVEFAVLEAMFQDFLDGEELALWQKDVKKRFIGSHLKTKVFRPKERSPQIIRRYAPEHINSFRAHAVEIRRLLERGASLESELRIFASGGIDAVDDKAGVATTITEVLWEYNQSALHWIKSVRDLEFETEMRGAPGFRKTVLTEAGKEHLNDLTEALPTPVAGAVSPDFTYRILKGMISWIRSRSDAGDTSLKHAKAMLKLNLLIAVDESLLIPYVRSRFEEEWNNQFENLDEEGRTEAAKLRMLRELQ